MGNQLPFFFNTVNPLSNDVAISLEEAYQMAKFHRNEFITPEHLLAALLLKKEFEDAMDLVLGSVDQLDEGLQEYLENLDKLPSEIKIDPSPSIQLTQVGANADKIVYSCGKTSIELSHIIKAIFNLEESTAKYLLTRAINGAEADFISLLSRNPIDDFIPVDEEEFSESFFERTKDSDWKKLVECISETYTKHNPLIGREEELNKTIRILCRKDKNNPLYIGEPGVGKTALIYGLANLIEKQKVPDKLKDAKIYRLDLGNLIAGTQYRGDFEKRIKTIMEGALKESNVIIFIDEIHNLVGAGAIGDSSMDASNILKPYLENGEIRFIGATTYDEYKRYFSKSKSILRRFSNIDVPEPNVEETIHILNQLRPLYENFHKVKYTDEAIEFAVKGSMKHINDRFLPDKAIDVLDECGAEKQLESENQEGKTVNKDLVAKILAKICKVDSIIDSEESKQELSSLEIRISSQLFGQPQAVKEVSEAILMSKAGLEEENKPLASLLFVGPTGVGKTELAKLLAKELGIELLRFDMSEYTEKHTVAKLIGSPAGYVGYEDGGLLTDAIRKNPNAVLLLDEIEKAHPDIYNILLQVMDYAKLTDNKGNKADFRNVVLIMTSNAGAQYAAQANVGFNSNVTQGDAMLKQVKKIFKPEFLNRLSGTVVFNEMSKEMAHLILNKKLEDLNKKLRVKNAEMIIEPSAKEFLVEKGFTTTYGARELDRVILQEVKRKLMNEILFGTLKEGGKVLIYKENNELRICRK